MAIMISRRKLEPGAYEGWKQRFAEAAPLRKAAGCKGVRRYRNAADPDEVIVIMEWDSEENCRNFVGMRLAGVANQPDALFVEEIDVLES